MTGIVGPNGCGKSNLVEALRWVMGETSAKRMRGGEMDDVIFAGTHSRPARNVAEVRLMLDNRDRKLPSQFNDNDELEITRRIERGNGSAYEVNGQDVRARDVQLLFADAATGAHSTAMVSQGRVGAIINAKPDRPARAARGGGRHHRPASRRHEAELRLKAAETNLARLDDVIMTLEASCSAEEAGAPGPALSQHRGPDPSGGSNPVQHPVARCRARRAAAEADIAGSRRSVVDLDRVRRAAATRQGEAADLPDLREAEADAAAELQRLTIARKSLNQEEARVNAARTEASQRLTQESAISAVPAR